MTPTTSDPAPGQAVLLYDGRCQLCVRSVGYLRRLDWFGRVACRDGRDPANYPPTPQPLDPQRLTEEMHLVTPDRHQVYHGFGAFRWMAWRLPPLWLVAPLLYLPGVPALGQRVYLWVARNRFHLVPCHEGACVLPPKKR